MRELTGSVVLALHALHLMMWSKKPVSQKAVRQSGGFIPEEARPVMAKLRRSGLIRSVPEGGYVLAKAPGEITVEEVVRAIEEPKPPAAPCGGDYEACASRGSCILAPLCRNAGERFQATLRAFTLADLMGKRPDLPNCVDPKLGALVP